MLLVAMMALVLVAAASAAIAQDEPKAFAGKEGKAEAIVDDDVKAKAEKGKAEAKAGDVVAKSEAEKPKKEEKKEEEKKEEKKELPKSGGTGSASLLALGAGALLIGGGLLARRIIR